MCAGVHIKKFSVQYILPTLLEQIIAAIPRGRQQQKVLKMDHPRQDEGGVWRTSIVSLCQLQVDENYDSLANASGGGCDSHHFIGEGAGCGLSEYSVLTNELYYLHHCDMNISQ